MSHNTLLQALEFWLGDATVVLFHFEQPWWQERLNNKNIHRCTHSHDKHIHSYSSHWILMMDVFPLSESTWTTVSQNNYKHQMFAEKKSVDINITLKIGAILHARAK